MKRSKKENFVSNLKEELKDSTSVVVSHYSGLTVNESENLRNEMRKHGAKFKVTKNRLTKLALKNTQFEKIADLFVGPTAIAYSDDPIAAAKVAVSFEKKHDNFKIIGGGYEGQKIDIEKINFLATLPSLDELKAKLLLLIMSPAQKIASVVSEPGAKLARAINAKSKSLEESN